MCESVAKVSNLQKLLMSEKFEELRDKIAQREPMKIESFVLDIIDMAQNGNISINAWALAPLKRATSRNHQRARDITREIKVCKTQNKHGGKNNIL